MNESMSGLLSQATAQAREQHRKNEAHKLPHMARFKAVFIYKNGSYSPPYHSYDRHGNHLDERLGLVKLIQLIHKRRGEFVCASIFANLNEKPMVRNAQGNYTRDYNTLVYKEVCGKPPVYANSIKFEDGKLLR